MQTETQERLLSLADRLISLLDKWIERKYPVQEDPEGEVWKKGDPLPEPQTVEEYRDFPRDGLPGRFQQAIANAQKSRSE